MKITNDEISEYGYDIIYFIINNRLGRKLVENGFNDITVRINDDTIPSVKSILIIGNKTFKKLLEDEKLGNELVLYEECNKNGFLELEKYYSGETIELTTSNVCDVLMFCICYNEEVIEKKCEEFIIANVDDDIIIGLVHIMNVFPNNLSELHELRITEFEKRGYKYLYKDEWLLLLEENNLEDLLSCGDLVIRNETWFLNRLLMWYSYKINNKKCDSELLNEFRYLIKYHFHNDKVNINELKKENENVLKSLNITFQGNKSVKYVDLCKIRDEKLQNIIIKYFSEDNNTTIEEEDMTIISKLSEEERNDFINTILESDNIKMIEIGMMIMNDMNIVNKFDLRKNRLLLKLCIECDKYSNTNKRLLKCLSLFVDDINNIKIIEAANNGESILYRIFNECDLKSKPKEVLKQYIDEKKKELEEEENRQRQAEGRKKRKIAEEEKAKRLTEEEDKIKRIIEKKNKRYDNKRNMKSFYNEKLYSPTSSSSTSITVHCKGFTTVYWYNSPLPSPAWPGVPLVEKDGWMTFEMENMSSGSIIFNNNGAGQTPDLFVASSGEYWYVDGNLTTDKLLFSI